MLPSAGAEVEMKRAQTHFYQTNVFICFKGCRASDPFFFPIKISKATFKYEVNGISGLKM